MKTKIAITLDVEWASDEIIDYISSIFLKNNIKSTWLVTHPSESMKRILKNSELFEAGIHPNFMSNTTQGKNMDEIMSYLLKICPQAKIMRTHCLYQSTHIFDAILEKFPSIKIDVSLFLPYCRNIEQHKLYVCSCYPQRYMVRIPYVWEDDLELRSPNPAFKFNENKFSGSGLKILNFHPLYIALNSNSWDSYLNFKKNYTSRFQEISLKEVFKYRQNREGIENFLIDLLQNKNLEFLHIGEALNL